MTLSLPTGRLLLLGEGSIIIAPYQQCMTFEQLRAQLIKRVDGDINTLSLLTGNPTLQPQTSSILNIPTNHQCIFALLFACRGQANRDVVDQYAVEDHQQRLESRLLALKPPAQRNKQMCGECLDGVILIVLSDPRSQAMQIAALQVSQ